MLKDIKGALPKVIKDFLDAHLEKNQDKFMAAFAPDALVNDAQREFHGLEKIRAWAEDEIFGPNVTIKVEQAYQQYDDIIVRGNVDGAFDKSKLPNPFILTYYFSIKNEKIVRLIILFNKSNA